MIKKLIRWALAFHCFMFLLSVGLACSLNLTEGLGREGDPLVVMITIMVGGAIILLAYPVISFVWGWWCRRGNGGAN